MKRAVWLGTVWLACVLAAWGCRRESAPEPVPPQGPLVRVQVFPDLSGTAYLRAPGAVKISTLPDLVLRYQGVLDEPTVVAADGEGFRLGRQFYPSPIRISPRHASPLAVSAPHGTSDATESGPAEAARAYRGVLDLFNMKGRIRIVNEVSLEEYVAGVVGSEMPASFPAAALEAQAIASRSYALYHLLAQSRSAPSRGFEAGPSFQVYRGLQNENDAVRSAVRATAGWVLTHQGKLFPAYFHSTCGGNTTNGSLVFGHPPIPPLRGAPCDGCFRSANHRWSFAAALRDVETILRPWAESHGIALGALKALEGVDPLPGGYLRYIRVRHAGGSFEMVADHFRSRLVRGGLSGLKSTAFEVEAGSEAGTVVFRGAGWGHGVGLCQNGAGWKGREAAYPQLLAHYFPESELKRVY